MIKPTVVCLCGSTRFKDPFIEANKSETLKGNIVLSVGLFGHHEELDMDGECKAMLDNLHLRKIDLSDEVEEVGKHVSGKDIAKILALDETKTKEVY
jgi:hypothetical protein